MAETARRCLAGYDPSTLMLAADSTGVVTDRNDKTKKRRDIVVKTGRKAEITHESGAKKAERIRKALSGIVILGRDFRGDLYKIMAQ